MLKILLEYGVWFQTKGALILCRVCTKTLIYSFNATQNQGEHQIIIVYMYLLALVFSMGRVVRAVEKFSVEQLNSDHGKD